MKPVFSTIIALLAFVLLDILWIKYVMSKKYATMIKNIQSGAEMKTNTTYILLSYTLLFVGLIYFVFQNSNLESPSEYLLGGCIFGLVTYGIYNFTAGSVLENWSGTVVLYDIVWGVVLCGLCGLTYGLIRQSN